MADVKPNQEATLQEVLEFVKTNNSFLAYSRRGDTVKFEPARICSKHPVPAKMTADFKNGYCEMTRRFRIVLTTD